MRTALEAQYICVLEGLYRLSQSAECEFFQITPSPTAALPPAPRLWRKGTGLISATAYSLRAINRVIVCLAARGSN
jgi:hypothetical protein